MKILFLLSILIAPLAHAHKGKHHDHEALKPQFHGEEKLLLAEVNADYQSTVKPIFEKKCMDCHSQNTHYPWYHSLPLVKSLLDNDIKEARTHLDITNGFPFEGHGTPLEDLDEIAETTNEGDMPPLTYVIMHPGTRLSPEEKKEILAWVERSRKRLELK